MKKLCYICKVKPRYTSTYCKSCEIKRVTKWSKSKSGLDAKKARRDTITKLIRKTKRVACKDCGNKFHFCAMDFDHVRGVKKFNIAHAPWHYRKLKTVLEEIAKCDIICANCHRVRSYKRKQHLNDRKKRK